MSRVVLLCILLLTGTTVLSQGDCFTMQYEAELLKQHPHLFDQITKANSLLNNTRSGTLMTGPGAPVPGVIPVITIPVVVHILYKEASENISDAQVLSQIDALNKAFRHRHADTAKVPAWFRELAADVKVEFCLARVDPKGRATTGIVRKNTWVTMFGIDDRIKFSDMGGDDAWDSEKYLNIWVGNLAGGLIGYSSPIGGPRERDGIAIRSNAFGTTGTVSAPYYLGRTAVHEVGHWLGLRHIWGDVSCGDDLVHDTPKQRLANRGCPSGIKQGCENTPYGEMYMNYMDLTNDECVLMFTEGQADRMRSVFAEGGPRFGILSSQGCSGTPVLPPIESPETDLQAEKIINLYPNPAQNILVVDIRENTNLIGQEIQIINQYGQAVRSVRLNQAKTTVNISQLARGMYFIKVNGGSKKYQDKFLKL
ncbi:MAG TPA: T9SS type A sorting domain-containing protein [Chitinophagaceae bacterium]